MKLDGKSRRKLAEAMAAPLKRMMNYSSVARQAFDAKPICVDCGMVLEESADHTFEECVVYGVMET